VPSDRGYFSLAVGENGIEFVCTGNEVLIVPLTTDGEVILTIEPSAAFGEPTIILPGGETELSIMALESWFIRSFRAKGLQPCFVNKVRRRNDRSR